MFKIGKDFSVKLGYNIFINVPNVVVYDNKPLFWFKRSDDGILGINFDVFDSGGNKIAIFRNSVVVQGDEQNYEIKSSHSEYAVKEKSSGRVIAQVKRRDVNGADLEVEVSLYTSDGFLFEATPTHMNVLNNTFSGCKFKNGSNGIVIEKQT